LDGKFTLHGVTRNLKLIAEVTEATQRNHLRASFTIKQTDFGITPYSKAFGAVGVTDELKIYGEIDVAK
jgi:polyisoprenoid-binding protein YceI